MRKSSGGGEKLLERIKELIKLWRSRCPFFRRFEEWRMKRKVDFKVR
ncbi:hypothetical protein CHITON_0275 [Thermococcus chitonophagus]|uniref:Uncharacterized protein n=1 Tax=Thermococcus chitonophagus TaxID=54262 RepID=A0A170SBI9_9EURY|nr:hypothetical protein CHITON_0275 [Thermococcus chitonophagus]